MTAIPVHFVVLPRVYLLDLAGVADALRNANRIAGRTVFDCGFHGVEASAETSIGLPLARLEPLPDRLADGALVIVAGVTPIAAMRSEAATRTARWLRTRIGPSQRIACVCAGAFLAGRAGLLDGRECTTHHEDCDTLQVENPRARVLHNRIFVEDGHLMTSAGVTAGIDLALHLIARHAGPAVALAVARTLVVYVRRTGSDAQLSPWFAHRNHLHPVVHRAQDAILADPTRDWTLATIADVSHASVRHLTRLFREEAGVTALDYLHDVRLAIAREKFATSDHGVERIAEEAGFSSAHQMRRVLRSRRAPSPTVARERAKRLSPRDA